MKQNRTVLLAAGGTGGHVFPAIALAEFLQGKGFEVEFATDARGEKYFGNYNFKYKIISSASPNGFGAALKLLKGFLQSFSLVRKFDVVIGFGGYPSFAPVLAAKVWRKKTILHEQNAVLGKVNRVLQKYATHVAISFSQTKFAEKATYVGSFVRKDFAHSPLPTIGEKLNILIIGGSQGAKVFSNIFPQAFAGLNVKVVHQVPESELEKTQAEYEKLGIEVDLKPFFTDIKQRIEAAHLVISRAGSSSIFELVAIGRPAIFVPLPSAADNHQFENARELAEKNACWLVAETAGSGTEIAKILADLSANPAKLAQSAEIMHNQNHADSKQMMLELIEK